MREEERERERERERNRRYLDATAICIGVRNGASVTSTREAYSLASCFRLRLRVKYRSGTGGN